MRQLLQPEKKKFDRTQTFDRQCTAVIGHILVEKRDVTCTNVQYNKVDILCHKNIESQQCKYTKSLSINLPSTIFCG